MECKGMKESYHSDLPGNITVIVDCFGGFLFCVSYKLLHLRNSRKEVLYRNLFCPQYFIVAIAS